jgi:hypothetical protein
MNWNHRISVVIPPASKAIAEAAARQINSTGPDYDGDAFTVRLSASGDYPATHYGLCTSATDEMVSAMADALPFIPGVQFWRHDIDGRLTSSNVTDPTGQAWGWVESLNAAGLKQIIPPLE